MEGFLQAQDGVDPLGGIGRLHTDHQVQVTDPQGIKERSGGGHGETQVQVGIGPPVRAHRLGPMVDGHGVDSPEADGTRRPGPAGLSPPGQVPGLGHHPPGVGQNLASLGSQAGEAAMALK